MKRIIIFVLVFILPAVMGAGCVQKNTPQGSAAPSASASQSPSAARDSSYAFTFEDLDGNNVSLSDFEGQPVYLKVWGSWCPVCMDTLSDLNDFAGEEHDFVILSVIFPEINGEMNKQDFIEWYKGLGYDSLTVLIDEDAQILYDFGISAFPSQIMFDSQGIAVTGYIGEIANDDIVRIMSEIANGTFQN